VHGADRLAGVHALEERQFVGVLLDEVGDAQQVDATVLGGRAAPRSVVEGLASGGDGGRDVGRGRVRDETGRWIWSARTL
jgi:hypothetical protein